MAQVVVGDDTAEAIDGNAWRHPADIEEVHEKNRTGLPCGWAKTSQRYRVDMHIYTSYGGALMALTTRRLVAIPLLGVALTFAAFGIVRGVVSTGPARGERLIVGIEPPGDDAARTMAVHVARARIDDSAIPVRVIPAGDRLVIEVGTDDAGLVQSYAQLLERTATLELRANDGTVVDGRTIRRAEVLAGGVALEVARSDKTVTTGATIEVVLDGKPRMTVTADRVAGTEIHVRTSGETEDASLRAAVELVEIVEAGAVHPLHVRRQESFERATGFVPRAWPFLAIAGVFLIVVAVLWRRR